jgi:hypothetical protein
MSGCDIGYHGRVNVSACSTWGISTSSTVSSAIAIHALEGVQLFEPVFGLLPEGPRRFVSIEPLDALFQKPLIAQPIPGL